MIEIIPNWHPVFVHFTLALISVSLGLFIVGRFANCDQAILVAKWNLWIGAGISLLTLVAGVYAYNTVAHDTPSHEAMTEHRNWALATLALLVPVVIWSVLAHRQKKAVSMGFLALFLVVGGLLATTGWHGAEVVYRHGVGVMSLPKTDTHDHGAHDHGEGDDHGEAGHDDVGHDSHDMSHDDLQMDDMSMEEMEMDDMAMDSLDKDDGHHDDGHDHTH